MKISELISKNIYFLLFILILKINISFETSLLPSIKIYAEDIFKVTCDSHFFIFQCKFHQILKLLLQSHSKCI